MDGALVSDLARRALGRDLEATERLAREEVKHRIWRLRDRSTGETVIAKVGVEPTSDRAHRIDDEYAALTFLASFPRVPNVLGAIPEARMILLEDLGDGPSPLDLLNAGTADSATEALIAGVRTMGELHRATRNRQAEWTAWRVRFAAPPGAGRLFRDPWPDVRTTLLQAEIDAAAQSYAEICQAVGVTPGAGFEEEIALVAETIEYHPGPFGCLAGGDQNVPAQFLLRSGEAWAIDFDACGFRHALIDAVCVRTLWASVERIPEEVVAILERTYREAFAPETGMDYERHYRLATARWNILHIIHRLPWALEGDFMRSARTTLRQQMLLWLEMFGEGNAAETTALAGTSAEIHHQLKQRWSDLPPVPTYAAYAAC